MKDRTPRTHTSPKESATRKRVDAILNNLRWKTDEHSPHCNVVTERAKTVVQSRKLNGRKRLCTTKGACTMIRQAAQQLRGALENLAACGRHGDDRPHGTSRGRVRASRRAVRMGPPGR